MLRRRGQKTSLYVRALGWFLILYLLASAGLYVLEHDENPKCRDVYDALWLTTVFLFSGFEEFGPVTAGGRILSLGVFIVGAGLMVAVTAKIASVFVTKELKEVTVPDSLNDGFVVCHWNDRGDRIIKELHADQAAPDAEIVVITPAEVNETQLRRSPAYEKVFFIRSDPTLHDVLKACRVEQARSVLLLANDASPDPDAESALIALAISRLCDNGRKPHIVVEAINHRKMQHLRDAGADEVVCATDYGLGILAQCALQAKLSDVYHNLLTYSEETNEIYIVDGARLPKAVIGLSFAEAAHFLLAHRDPHNPAVLIGVKRDGRTILNPMEAWSGPETERFERFQPGDGLIVLAYNPPDFSYLNEAMAVSHQPVESR